MVDTKNWLAWFPLEGETREHAVEVRWADEAYRDAENAASHAAEKRYEEGPLKFRICIESPDGAVTTWDVSGEAEINWSAYEADHD
jgi:hypothetical protein